MHILQFKWLAIIHTHSHTHLHTHIEWKRDSKRVAANSECSRCHSIIHLERQAIVLSRFLYSADCIIVEQQKEKAMQREREGEESDKGRENVSIKQL